MDSFPQIDDTPMLSFGTLVDSTNPDRHLSSLPPPPPQRHIRSIPTLATPSISRSRSVPLRQKRRNSIITLSSRPIEQLRPEDPSAQPSNTIPKLCTEVLHLFTFMLKQDLSPLRSTEPGTKQSKFLLKTWYQQKRLLELQLRRLKIWDTRARENEGHDFIVSFDHGTNAVEEAFSTIGKTLVRLLRDEAPLNQHIACVERMSYRNDRAVHLSEDDSQSSIEEPLKTIKTAIDNLCEILPIERKSSLPRSRSAADFATLDLRPAKSPARPREDVQSINKREIRLQEALSSPKTEPTREGRRVHFSFEDSNDDAVGSIASTSGSQTATVQETNDGELPLESKIILKIADRPDAFQKSTTLQRSGLSTSTTEGSRPQINRTYSNKTPMQSQRFDIDDVSLLTHNFASMSLSTKSSFANIANKLLTLARVENPSRCEHEICSSSNAGMSRSSRRLDSILALITSLPDWQIYTTLDQKQHAKLVVSMIYFSLLEEVVGCAVDFSRALQTQLKSSRDSTSIKSQVRFFCACIQRLSRLNQAVDSKFRTVQPQLQKVISNLKSLDERTVLALPGVQSEDTANAGTTSSICKDCGLEMDTSGKIIDSHSGLQQSSFQKFRPLALACYLSPSTNLKSTADTNLAEAAGDGMPDFLKSQNARDLFSFGPKVMGSLA